MANNCSPSAQYKSSVSNIFLVSTTIHNDQWLNFYGNFVELEPGQWDISSSGYATNGGGTTYIFVCLSSSPANNDAESTIQPLDSTDIELQASIGGSSMFYDNNGTPLTYEFIPGGSSFMDNTGPSIRVKVKNKTRIYVNGLFGAVNTSAISCSVAIYAKRVG